MQFTIYNLSIHFSIVPSRALPERRRLIVYGYALTIALLSIQLTLYLQFFFWAFSAIVGGLFFWQLFHKKLDEPVSEPPFLTGKWLVLALLIPFAVLIFTRVILFIKYSDFPQLGYDMGIYKYEFERAKDFSAALKTSFYPGLIILVSLLQKLGVPVSFLMREFYIGLNLLIGLMVYLTGREFFGKRAGFLALIFYAASITQFNAYYFFLYKNVLALSLLLGTFILLRRHSYGAILTGVYLGVVQPPDFLILAAVMVISFLWNIKKAKDRRYWLITGGTIAALFLGVFLFKFNQIIDGIKLILNHEQHWDPSISGGGVFIGFSKYVEQAIYYLPFFLIGFLGSLVHFKGKHKTPRFHAIHMALILSLAIVIFKWIFYRRYIIELDLFVILFAGLGCSYLWRWYSQAWWQKTLWILGGVLILWNITLESWNTGPLIPPLEAARIGTLCRLSAKNALVMATDSFYSPWLRGYSCHEVIAPGLFELNRWNYEAWKEFWTGDKILMEKRMEELKVYRKPIYVFVGDMQQSLSFEGVKGFSKVRSYLWRWDFVRN